MCGAVQLCCAMLCCAHAGAQEQLVMTANAAKAVAREQTLEGSQPVTLCAKMSLNCHAEEHLLKSL